MLVQKTVIFSLKLNAKFCRKFPKYDIREDTVIVSPEWLGVCFSQGNRLNMSDYSYSKPLHNVMICVSGYKKGNQQIIFYFLIII